MKKSTFGFLSNIPLMGPFIRLYCDPMLSCSFMLDDGLPEEIREYQKKHPDEFITTQKLREIYRKGQS